VHTHFYLKTFAITIDRSSHQQKCKNRLLQTDILDEDKRLISAVDYYFIQEDGSRFKVRTDIHCTAIYIAGIAGIDS